MFLMGFAFLVTFMVVALIVVVSFLAIAALFGTCTVCCLPVVLLTIGL